jgi:hypothetical protein
MSRAIGTVHFVRRARVGPAFTKNLDHELPVVDVSLERLFEIVKSEPKPLLVVGED